MRAAVVALLALSSACAPRPSEGEGAATPAAPVGFEGLDALIVVDDGARTELRDHLVAGKITVIDFYADWCEPCRHVDRWIRLELRRNDRLAVRKVNVVAWGSPVARQYLLGDAPELPYLVVFAPDGSRVGEVWGGRISHLRRAIREAGDR